MSFCSGVVLVRGETRETDFSFLFLLVLRLPLFRRSLFPCIFDISPQSQALNVSIPLNISWSPLDSIATFLNYDQSTLPLRRSHEPSTASPLPFLLLFLPCISYPPYLAWVSFTQPLPLPRYREYLQFLPFQSSMTLSLLFLTSYSHFLLFPVHITPPITLD